VSKKPMHTFKELKSARPDTDMSLAVVEMGQKGELDAQHAAEAARAILSIREKYPAAKILLAMAGYDDDERALWEVPEVCSYLRILFDAVFTDWPGGELTDLNLEETSLGCVALCLQQGR
jgi:hypothetical protein